MTVEWKLARSKDTIKFRDPIPDTRVVRYKGTYQGMKNPILYPLSDSKERYETVDMFKANDPEPDKLEEIKVEALETTFHGVIYNLYAIPGEDVIVQYNDTASLMSKKKFDEFYEIIV